MALLDDGEASYEPSEPSSHGYQSQGRPKLLSDYNIVHSHLFGSLITFQEICKDFFADLMEGDMKLQYLGFTHVKLNDISSIDEIRCEFPKMTFLYDSSEEVLILKFMVGVTHEICASLLQTTFVESVRVQTNSIFSIIGMKSTRFRGLRRMKEADDSFKPRSRCLASDWPSIVFEVGVSDQLTQLQQDARFWLECSGEQTRIVILANVDTKARTITIERWQDAPALQPPQNVNVPILYSQQCFPTLMQSLTLQEGQFYVGAPLSIPSALVFDVLPFAQGAPFGSSDFEITGQMLNELNDVYWGCTSLG